MNFPPYYGLDPVAYKAFVVATFTAWLIGFSGLGAILFGYEARRDGNRGLALALTTVGVLLVTVAVGPTVNAISVMTGCDTAPNWLYILGWCWL